METITLILLLISAVLVSAVIDQIVPKVSLPLIQVGMGVIIALFASRAINIDLEPDLFLVLFIAPLLYLEAKDADKSLLWRNRRPIFSLAIGLVVATTLIIGFVLNAFVPSITLAAAFALGAALGPTDAVAVTSLSKYVNIPQRQMGILKGELLLNDASGIVSFQFAIAAATTGAFSLMDASIDFIVEFIGGLIVGVVLGYLANFVLRKIRDIGIENTTFHVLYEVCIPFLVYMISSSIHVSGVIAVVVAGLVNVIAPRTTSPLIAQMNIVSTNVWRVISFALNGVVFVLLGTQLPSAMLHTWEDRSIDNLTLILLTLLLTFVLFAVRFIWCTVMEYIHVRGEKDHRFSLSDIRNALIVTLCGAKGTITLSILFTIPVFIATTGVRFPERNLIIFLGSGVIVLTLLVATFVVPLVAPKKVRKTSEIEERQAYFECLTDILRNVIEQLTAQQTKRNRRATRSVIKIYQDRIDNIKDSFDIDVDPDIDLKIRAIGWEEEKVVKLIDSGEVSHEVGFDFLARLERMERYAKHAKGNRFHPRRIISFIRLCIARIRNEIYSLFPDAKASQRSEERRKLQMMTTEHVIDILHSMVADSELPTEDVSKLLLQYENALMALRSSSPSVTTTFKIADESDDIKRLAYQIELEEIQKMYEQDRIDRQMAKNMRDNVFLMQMDLEDKF